MTLESVRAAVAMTSCLVVLDPGLVSPALTIWRRFDPQLVNRPPTWRLRAAYRVHQAATDEDTLPRALKVAEKLWSLASREVLTVDTVFLSEWPEARSAGRGKNSASQLMGMCAMAARVAARFSHVHTIGPSEWGETTPKAAHGDPRKQVRGSRVWGLLDEDERKILPLQGDCYDSAGMGLVATGRARPGLKSLLDDAKVRRV